MSFWKLSLMDLPARQGDRVAWADAGKRGQSGEEGERQRVEGNQMLKDTGSQNRRKLGGGGVELAPVERGCWGQVAGQRKSNVSESA